MFFSSAINFLILISIIGYSYIFKFLFFARNKDKGFYNADIVFGLFFLIFFSLVLNFFSPLNFFLVPIILIGTIFFFKCWKDGNLKVNLFFYLLFIFLFVFISYHHGDNVDSPMYHLQIIKWVSSEKIVLGLTNLEIRFGSNSLWFNLISLYQFKLKNFNSIFIFNIIPLAILLTETMNKKKTLSYIFLILTVSFLLFFSYLHPYNNGVILNHLRNPELDIPVMVFFILSFYFFLKCIEKKSIQDLNLLIFSSMVCLIIKVSHAGVILLPIMISILYFKKNLITFLIQKSNLFLIFFLILWFFKNLFISGCLLFPLSFTCFETGWSVGVEKIDEYSKIIKSYARDTPERSRYSDFNYTINSFQWFIPWFKEYALKNALLKISFTIFSTSLILLFICKFFKFLNKIKNLRLYFASLIILFLNLFLWFQAPEIRFGWGVLLALTCLPLSILIFYNKFFDYLKIQYFSNIPIILFSLLLIDNQKNFNLNNLVSPKNKSFDYSQIIKFSNYQDKDFYYSKNWKCYDFKKICVNSPKDNYILEKKSGYLIFLNNK